MLSSSLDELHGRMHSCRLCLNSGHDVFPKAIFSGAAGAEIMIIGQAPGITEVEAGRPFNAGSGTRLFQWLEGAGIEEDWFRTSQYLTSVTKCFPGKAQNGSGDRVPSKAEQALCKPYLEYEIQFINPKLIIPVGRLSINLFYPTGMPLSEIIGTEKMLDGRWIIPLPHPSGASRWHQIEDNRRRIDHAITLISKRYHTITKQKLDGKPLA
ncbi:MAG: uracil-DNA glycosylase [Anaerolineales bacterium]|nr:uracil-DNA glycosylase [Anaerolineales bacterium]